MADVKKLTKREVITMMMSEDIIRDNEVYMGYLKNELELLNKRSSRSGKLTKAQEANIDLKEQIYKVLADMGELTVTEICKALSGDYTSQKISALLRQLKEAGRVDRRMDKKKALYFVIENKD